MPSVIAFAGGKGGTGTSILAGNAALLLATVGKRVVLIDATTGGSGLHGVLGVGPAERALPDATVEGGPTLAELATPTGFAGLSLIAGDAHAGSRDPLDASAAARIRPQLRQLEAEYVLIDLPSGPSTFAVDLFNAADLGVLVILPEPPAVELAYRLLRQAFARRLEQAGLAELLPSGQMPDPLDIAQRAPEARAHLAQVQGALVVNSTRTKSDLEVGPAVATVARRRLAVAMRNYGHIEYDDAVWVAQRRKRALMVEHPESRAAKCIERVTRKILGRDNETAMTVDVEHQETHYQLLEIEPTASEEDIRRAYRRVRQLYGRDALAVSGALDREEVDSLQRRFDEAYQALMDPPRRREYDLELFPDGIPSTRDRRRRSDPALPALRRAAKLDPDIEITGEVMRQVRESLGIELREISERTKIGTTYLGAIEGEAFDKLPAPVYVRGFLTEYAKAIGIDPDRMLDSYYPRFLAARGDGAEH